MKKQLTKLALIVAAALAIPVAVAAQAGPGPGGCPGCGRTGNGPGQRMFDPKTITTVQGDVVAVQRVEGRRHTGVHLTVAVGSESVDVHLGPDFYVDAQALQIAKGDRIEVKGSRITFDGKPAVVAQEVRRGAEVLALRDASGTPAWRGQGMGAR